MIRLRGRLRSTITGALSVVSALPRWPRRIDSFDPDVKLGGQAGGNGPDELVHVFLFLAVGNGLPGCAGLVGPPEERHRARCKMQVAGPPGDRHLAGVRAGSDLGRIQLNRRGRRVNFNPRLRWIARRQAAGHPAPRPNEPQG